MTIKRILRMGTAVSKFKELIVKVSPRQYFILAALFAFAVFFIGLGSRHIGGGDEPRVAGIAAEIYLFNDWVEPQLNNKPFLEKPPLYFWADALSMKIFGRNDFAAKFPSAVAAFLGVLSLFSLARGLKMSAFGAFLSVIFLSTAAQYWNYGRKCMIDIFVAVFVAFAMWAFWELCNSDKAKKTALWFIFFVIALGGGIFSKGLVGLALPCSALFFFLAIDDFYIEKKFNLKRWILLFAGAALSFIPVALWVWALYEKSGFEAVKTVVWTNNFGRFFGLHPDHNEPFYYYFPKLFEQLQPWTVLLPFAIWFNIRKLLKEKDNKALFMLCWLIIPYTLLMVSSGKRQVYVLPLYAGEVLLIANMLDHIYRDKFKLPEKWDYVNLATSLLGILFTVGLCGGAIAFLIIGIVTKIELTAYIYPVVMLACGIAAILGMRKKDMAKVCLGFVIGLGATYVSIDTVARPMKNHRKSYHAIFDYCKQQIKDGRKLYLYKPIERENGAALFYLGVNCPRFNFKETKVDSSVIILLNQRDSEEFLNAGFKVIEKFKTQGRKYWIMAHE
jgi:4-amino-4-deoxy-L-arabinose transferase-like glycosyltransferase